MLGNGGGNGKEKLIDGKVIPIEKERSITGIDGIGILGNGGGNGNEKLMAGSDIPIENDRSITGIDGIGMLGSGGGNGIDGREKLQLLKCPPPS